MSPTNFSPSENLFPLKLRIYILFRHLARSNTYTLF